VAAIPGAYKTNAAPSQSKVSNSQIASLHFRSMLHYKGRFIDRSRIAENGRIALFFSYF
jgi:hypothetical protein